MRIKSAIWAFLAVCMLISACGRAVKPPEWDFEKEAIRVHVKTDQRLNLYNQKAHTLYVCFYQLSELKAFDQLARDEAGIRKLLEGKLFDDSVAITAARTVVPGENITVILDRAERARYFAVVTGYYAELSEERVVRRHKIAVRKERKGFFRRRYQCRPCPLDIRMVMGPSQIEYSMLLEDEDGKCGYECE